MKIKFAFLIAGLMLFILGFALYLNGPKRYIQFEKEKLGDWTSWTPAETSEEILWFFNQQSMRYWASNLTITVNVSTLDGTFWFCILDDSQFKAWQENKTINKTLVSKYVVDKFDLVFNPEENEKYHFIVDNSSNITSSARLSLWREGDFLRFDYSLMPSHLFVLASGLGICIVLGKKCSPSFDEFLKKWSLPIYKPLGDRKHDEEEIAMSFDAIMRLKRLAKYFVLILLSATTLYFLYDILSMSDTIVNLQSIRPEQRVVLIDALIRISILRTAFLFPLIVGVPLCVLVISPRNEDLSDMLKSKLGLGRRTEKQWLITKHMYQKVVQTAFSLRFLFFLVLIFSSFLLTFLCKSQVVTVACLTTIASALGIWAGYTIWSGFHEACAQYSIGKYAAKRYMKSSVVSLTVVMSIGWLWAFLLILFATSNFWISSIESVIFEPIALLEPWSGFIPIATVQFSGVLGALIILFCLVLLGFLFFILFPYLHTTGLKGLGGAFVVFSLTYITECSVSWAFQGTVSAVIQPLGLVGPVIAAAISQIAQGRYNKIIKKRLT